MGQPVVTMKLADNEKDTGLYGTIVQILSSNCTTKDVGYKRISFPFFFFSFCPEISVLFLSG